MLSRTEPREGYEDLPPAEWTEAEAMHHLTATFDAACKGDHDLMEPYIVRLAEAEPAERKEIMRCGLRETVTARYGKKETQANGQH